MVAGRAPPNFPFNREPQPIVPENQRGASDCDKVDRATLAVFGHDVKFHEITGLPLQQGSGALPDDVQAMTTHLRLIAHRDGVAAAEAMRAKLMAANRSPEEPAAAFAAAAERLGKTSH